MDFNYEMFVSQGKDVGYHKQGKCYGHLLV